MIFLTSTSQSIKLVTETTASVDWTTHYVDIDTVTGAVPNSNFGNLSAIGTTLIVNSASLTDVQRQIKLITVVNREPLSSSYQYVTVKKYDGANGYSLSPRALLQGGESLVYIDSDGWQLLAADGSRKTSGQTGPQGIQGPPGSAGGTDQTVQFNSGSSFSGSANLIYNYTNNTLSGTIAKFTNITSSDSFIENNITIIGSASLSSITNQAYIIYNSSSNKVEILPGIFIKGNIETTSSISASAVSASTYLGLPELYRITTTSSIQLTSIQSSVFAKNTVSSSLIITLPDAAAAKAKEYYFIKADAVSGTVSITPSGSNTINGNSKFDLNGPYHSVTLITDGNDWFVF